MANYLNEVQVATGKTVFTSGRQDTDGKVVTDVSLKGSASVKGGVVNVTTAGTRIQLPNVSSKEVTVIAKKGNTGSIFVGGNDVSATVFGVELEANESFTFNVANANAIWIDASVSGEGISYVAL